MKTTLDLLNAVIDLGIEQRKAIGLIDEELDEIFEADRKKPEETLLDDIYKDILNNYQEGTNTEISNKNK